MGYTGTDEAEKAWTVSDAPASYVDLLKSNIIGIEIEITRLEGKWKMGQELAPGDRAGTIEAFKALGTEVGDEISRTIEERGAMKDVARKPVVQQA